MNVFSIQCHFRYTILKPVMNAQGEPGHLLEVSGDNPKPSLAWYDDPLQAEEFPEVLNESIVAASWNKLQSLLNVANGHWYFEATGSSSPGF